MTITKKETEKAIRKYINQRLKEFKLEVLDIALKNNHPYIDVLFNETIKELRRQVNMHGADIRSKEEKYLFNIISLSQL